MVVFAHRLIYRPNTWNQLCREEPSKQENPCDSELTDGTWFFCLNFSTLSSQILISEHESKPEESCKVNPGNFQQQKGEELYKAAEENSQQVPWDLLVKKDKNKENWATLKSVQQPPCEFRCLQAVGAPALILTLSREFWRQ